MAHKADKYEPRIFIISKFRYLRPIFVLNSKQPFCRIFFLMGKTTSSLKIEKSFHVLAIKAIHVISEEELVIHLDDGVHKKKINIKCSIHPAVHLARQLLSAVKHYFPDFGMFFNVKNQGKLQKKQKKKQLRQISKNYFLSIFLNFVIFRSLSTIINRCESICSLHRISISSYSFSTPMSFFSANLRGFV